MHWIVSDPEHLGGAPRVRGTRVSISQILQALAAGITIPEILEEYPSLTEEAIRGVLQELSKKEERAAA